jgi:hypothetical protein
VSYSLTQTTVARGIGYVYSLNRLAHDPIEGRRGGGWPTAGCGRRAARARKSIALTAGACLTAQA